ncbi:hypothetical protein A0H76_2073 [Hepatospora eriocheir]|uniref:Uncharacterized protein n=1 Tax=Hepatospora eriocheir TaxID=1081669 RepID=A0A1X0QFZ1_9MICR|nr:hypothetical protein HERIO_464 [Hepatospora eriocheir]ORD98682.1 hypothetical protein A0H76_2073 [Hepatospora eriocheir]
MIYDEENKENIAPSDYRTISKPRNPTTKKYLSNLSKINRSQGDGTLKERKSNEVKEINLSSFTDDFVERKNKFGL